jgi:hypothetical protein
MKCAGALSRKERLMKKTRRFPVEFQHRVSLFRISAGVSSSGTVMPLRFASK